MNRSSLLLSGLLSNANHSTTTTLLSGEGSSKEVLSQSEIQSRLPLNGHLVKADTWSWSLP